MEMEITAFEEAMEIINFIIRSNFKYNPYSAFKILKQNPEATILKSVFEWSFLNARINENSTAISVPLPVTISTVMLDGRAVDVIKTDIKLRQKILIGELDTEKSIDYCNFDMFDAFDTDFSGEDIDRLFESSNFEFDSTDVVPILKQILRRYDIKLEESNLTYLGVESFFDVQNNKIFLETMTPQALLCATVSFIFKKTTTKNDLIAELESKLTIYILFYMLSFNFSTQEMKALQKAYTAPLDELDFFESVTRAVRVYFFIMESMNEEYRQSQEQGEAENDDGEDPSNSAADIFNNRKEI